MDEVSYGDDEEMNLEKLWQDIIKRKIDQARREKDKDYYYWLEDLVMQINCECVRCEVNNRNWR